ncbi:MAG: hypothetical protein WAU23_08030 [Ferruginibacter sp.]
MQHITIFDFLLLPVYLYIFYVIIKKKATAYTDGGLRKIFFTAFFLRMFGSVIYSLMIQYYYGYGDSFTFYAGGNFIIEQIQSDFGNINLLLANGEELQKLYAFQNGPVGGINGYIGISTAIFMMKLAVLVAPLTFNKFLITSLFFGLFSFLGQWRLFQVFNEINKGRNQKLLAMAVLYTPSIWFWGSGLLKDSVCLGAIGFIVSYLYALFIKKNYSIKTILLLLLMLFIVGSIKSYILIILAVSLATTFFFNMIAVFKNIVIKGFVVLVFIFASTTIAYISNFEEQLQLIAEESKVQVDTFQKNYEATEDEGKGTLNAEELDASVGGLLIRSPLAVFTCLFRPFIWESRKIMILFSSLESMLLLFSTLYLLFKLRFFGFINAVFSNQFLLFAFVFSILFALIIGFTTFNFGTIARYRIMLLPFYYFMLVELYSQYKSRAGLARERRV